MTLTPILIIISLILVFFIHFDTITWLIGHDWNRADFDFCYLIPLVVIYLIWIKKDKLKQVPSQPSWTGLIFLAFGVIFYLLGEFGGEYLSLYFSLWLMLFALAWTTLGWKKLKIIIFPLFFILTMFPPPSFIYSRITLKMQLISSQLGTYILHLLQIPAYREGNVIDVGTTQLEIVAACSGLRYLIPMVIVGLLMSYLFKEKLWKRVLLFLTTFPLAIVMNGFRLAATGYLARNYGKEIITGSYHDIMGWIIFVISIFILLTIMKLLSEKFGQDKKSKNLQEEEKKIYPLFSKQTLPKISLSIFLFLALILFVQYRQNSETMVQNKRPLAYFPQKIGPWTGEKFSLGREFIEALDFTDYIMINFYNSQGQVINFYVAYYKSQKKGESIHSPETCLRGGGWNFIDNSKIFVDLPKRGKIKFNRSVLEQHGQRMISYFWFPARGRILTNLYQLKIYNFWDALIAGRTDGSLIRVMTNIYPDENIDQADQRLKNFIKIINPLLEKFLPN